MHILVHNYLIYILYLKFDIPFRLRKAGRVWCGGARETHWLTCHKGVTPSKTKEFSNLPAFLDRNGSKTYVFPLPWILASITKGNSPGSPNLTFSLQSKNMSHTIYDILYNIFDRNSFLRYELIPDLFSVGLQLPIAKRIEILIILLSISPNNAGVAG